MPVSDAARDIAAQLKAAKDAKKELTTALPKDPTEAMQMLAGAITDSIKEAKELGVSPEKLAPLYNSLTRALEITAEMKGNLDRSTKILNYTKVDLVKEVEEYTKAIEASR